MRLGELSSLLIFGSGGLGYGRRLFSASKELGCGGLCPHPLRKLSFLRTFHLLPPLRTRGASCPMAGASHYHNGAAPSLRTTLLQKHIAAGKRRPPARSPRRLLRVSSWLRALPARPTLAAERGCDWGSFRPCWFLVRAGWGYGRWLFSASKELGCGGLCPHPLRKLSFLRTFLLLPPLRTRGAANPKRRRKPLPQWRSAVASNNLSSETSRSSRAATKAAWTASLTARQQLSACTGTPGCGSRRCGRAG